MHNLFSADFFFLMILILYFNSTLRNKGLKSLIIPAGEFTVTVITQGNNRL